MLYAVLGYYAETVQARIAHINGEVWSGDGKKLSAGAWPQASQPGWREAPNG